MALRVVAFLAFLLICCESRAQPVFTTEVKPSDGTVIHSLAPSQSPVIIMDDCGDSCQCPVGMTGVQPFCTPVSHEGTDVPMTEQDTTAQSPASVSQAAPPSPPPCPPGFNGVEPFCIPIAIPDTTVPTTPDYGGCPSKDPCFLSPEQNLQVVTGEDAVFRCSVGNIGTHFVAWMKQDELLSMGSMKFTSNKRMIIKDNGNQLVVSSVFNTDAGKYSCQINTTPPKKLYHTLEILVRPSAGIIPALEMIPVIEGQELGLDCETGGNPPPRVTWAKEGALLPSGDNLIEGAKLYFPSWGRDDGGIYVCTASNGVKSPAIARAKVRVNFAPTLETSTSLVRAREGGATELSCSVEGDPQPDIAWTRVTGEDSSTPIFDSTNHQIRETYVGRTTQSRLRIPSIGESDFGFYKCTASNAVGVDDAQIELSGMPERVSITSGRDCIIDTECSLSFAVSSLNTVVKYHVRVREFNNTANEYGNLTLITVEPSEDLSQGDTYVDEVLIKDLNPSTQYEVDVYAHTKFGAGPASPPHYLTTNYGGNISKDAASPLSASIYSSVLLISLSATLLLNT